MTVELETVARELATSAPAFPRYPAYRDSGVEWLGEIPAHWQVQRLKNIAAMNSEVLPEDCDPDELVSYVDISNVDATGSVLQTQGMRFGDAPSRARRKVKRGDTIISTVRTYLRAIAFMADPPDELVVSTGFAVLRPSSQMWPQYLWRLLQSTTFVESVVAYSEGVGYPAINPGRLGSLSVWVPPLAEQRAIAAYLDHETARIDALIAAKERLIALLQEKRAALISHAVTRGLDPSVPMKDSGVPWLGKIPAHWQVKRIAMAAEKITNGYVGPTRDIFVDEGIRYLQSLHIKGGMIKFDKPYYVTEEWSNEHSKSILDEGDILIVQTGDIGQVCAVPKEFVGCNCHALIIVRLKQGLGSGFYVSAFLRSDYGRNALRQAQTGALHPHLECGKVREIPILLPPVEEQDQIMEYLDCETAKLDTLVARIRQHIEKVKEYRAALISAAVTGKIDVRSEEPAHE